MTLIVQKFGGTSVSTVERIKCVATHIAACRQLGQRLVIVVSAMGEHTDELLKLAYAVDANPARREVDMLLSTGERVTMALLSIALNSLGVPSKSLTGSQSGILTDSTHGNARIRRILGERIRHGLESDQVVIVAGFQGMCAETKEITTLGRGGSDLTAVALAQALKADRCELYKDVPGIFKADPRRLANSKMIEALDWSSLLEMTWAGASVVHARAVELAKKFQIPLWLRSSFDLQAPGTWVRSVMEEPTLCAFVTRPKQTRVLLKDAAKKMPDVLNWLWNEGEAPLVVQVRGDDLELVAEETVCSRLLENFSDLDDLHRESCQSISLIGSGFWQTPELLNRLWLSLKVKPLYFESKNQSLTLLFAPQDFDSSYQSLTHEFAKELTNS